MNLEFNYGQSDLAYCSRCRMKEADFICKACSPFMYFCKSCDCYVHALSSKLTHDRQLIEKGYHSRELHNYERVPSPRIEENKNSNNRYNKYIKHENESLMESTGNYQKNSNGNFDNQSVNLTKSKSAARFKNNLSFDYGNTTHYTTPSFQTKHTQEILNASSPQNIRNSTAYSPSRKVHGDDYINELKRMYDREKEGLVNNVMILQKQLDIVRAESNERIYNLEHQLDESNKNNALNVKFIQDSHDCEQRKLFSEKDSEIKFLQNKILELEKSNFELLAKVNQNFDQLTHVKKVNSDRIIALDYELKKKDLELNELKNFYEKRIVYISDGFVDEKAKIINSYEKNIDKINNSYKESKEKFLNLISEQEADFKNLYKRSKLEEE